MSKTTILLDGESLTLRFARYRINNQPAIEAICEDGIPYGKLTTFTDGNLYKYECTLDTNNFPDVLSVLVEAGIVTPTGDSVSSGWCSYPIVLLTEKYREVYKRYE